MKYDIQHTSIVNIESGSIHTLEDNVGEANMFDELNSLAKWTETYDNSITEKY